MPALARPGNGRESESPALRSRHQACDLVLPPDLDDPEESWVLQVLLILRGSPCDAPWGTQTLCGLGDDEG